MDTAPHQPISCLVSVWLEHSADDLPMWRGVLVTAAGQRLHFRTMAQLERWLCELAGWQDPPPEVVGGAKQPSS